MFNRKCDSPITAVPGFGFGCAGAFVERSGAKESVEAPVEVEVRGGAVVVAFVLEVEAGEEEDGILFFSEARGFCVRE
jgi:hypothetical protein